METRIRVITDGLLLSLGLVSFDELGEPIDVNYDCFHSTSLEDLRNTVLEATEALSKPFLREDRIL